MNKYHRYLQSTLILILSVLLLSCEPRLHAKILAGYPPTFHFDGDDLMREFFICPDVPEGERNEKSAIWRIVPDSTHSKSWPLDITYGTVPEGFTQIVPQSGEKPPALEPAKRYSFHFVKQNGRGGGAFIIRAGTAVEQ